uniref:Uncharacterized protein n=1 Tax=Anguilla anguilla TaxID=7936 RepID=A0A0E9PEA1_ANGAN
MEVLVFVRRVFRFNLIFWSTFGRTMFTE